MISMTVTSQLTRFLDAQNQTYLKAMSEINNGQKQSHWMWFIFPQIKGLGKSETANFYAIKNIEEAEAYLAHPILGKHLIDIATALHQIQNKTATQIFGTPDDLKLRSSMTLFANVKNTNPIFEQVLEKYFNSSHDEYTLEILLKNKFSQESNLPK